LFEQTFQPFILGVCIIDVGFGFREQRSFFLVSEFDEHIARFNVFAVFEIHATDRVGYLGRNRHGFVGQGGADSLNHLGDGSDLRCLGNHQGGTTRKTTSRAGGGSGRLAITGRQIQADEAQPGHDINYPQICALMRRGFFYRRGFSYSKRLYGIRYGGSNPA